MRQIARRFLDACQATLIDKVELISSRKHGSWRSCLKLLRVILLSSTSIFKEHLIYLVPGIWASHDTHLESWDIH